MISDYNRRSSHADCGLPGSQVLSHACGVCQLLPSWHPEALRLRKLPIVAQPVGRADVELPLLQPGPHIYCARQVFAISTSKWRQIYVYAGLATKLCQLRSKHVLGTVHSCISYPSWISVTQKYALMNTVLSTYFSWILIRLSWNLVLSWT